MKYAAVLFDFDYTLANSESAILYCFHAVLQAHGKACTDLEIKRTIGYTLEDAFRTLMSVTDADELAALRREYVAVADRSMVAKTELYDGTEALLRALHDVPAAVGIISTKYRYRIADTLDKFGLASCVDLIVGGEDVTRHKPHPEGIELWIARTGVPKQDVLYVGDHVVDAQAAAAAGVDFAGVVQGTTTRGELEGYPHVAIADSIGALAKRLL